MAHTFWHSGILIGESDLEESSQHPRQRGGVFRPTAYGLEIFPRLTGILSAGHALKTHLEANGLSPEAMEAGEIDELLDKRRPVGKSSTSGACSAKSRCGRRTADGWSSRRLPSVTWQSFSDSSARWRWAPFTI